MAPHRHGRGHGVHLSRLVLSGRVRLLTKLRLIHAVASDHAAAAGVVFDATDVPAVVWTAHCGQCGANWLVGCGTDRWGAVIILIAVWTR
jgi:hypothetical protein